MVASLDNMLTTDQKGNIAETAITAAAVRLGVDVYRPVGEGVRCYSSRRIAAEES
jgi:hypothetical protein